MAFKKLVTEAWLTHGRTRLHLLTVHFQYFLRLNVSSQDLHFLSCELDHPKAETQTCLEGFRTQKIKDLLYKLFRLLLRVPYLSHNFMPLKWRIQVSRDTDSTDAPASFICGKDWDFETVWANNETMYNEIYVVQTCLFEICILST